MNKDNKKTFSKKYKEAFDNHYGEIPFADEIDFESKSIFIGEGITKRKSKRRYGTYVAAAAALLIIMTSTLTIVIKSESVEAVKDGAVDYLNDPAESAQVLEDENDETIIRIDSLSDKTDLDKVVDLMPHIYYSEDIFEKYSFADMSVKQLGAESAVSLTYYVDQEGNTLTLQQNRLGDEGSSFSFGTPDKEEVIGFGDLVLTIDVGDNEGLNKVEYADMNAYIQLIGQYDPDIMYDFVKTKIVPKL